MGFAFSPRVPPASLLTWACLLMAPTSLPGCLPPASAWLVLLVFRSQFRDPSPPPNHEPLPDGPKGDPCPTDLSSQGLTLCMSLLTLPKLVMNFVIH